jgi:hypothetical protein
MIIGISGLIGSGKDTIADYLQNIHQFRRESFANSLKDSVSMIFGWDRDMLEGRTRESREWREQQDDWWSTRLNRVITPRWVLQYWGTEVCRNGFHDDIWISSLENKLRKTHDDIVISDVRFPNEIKAIKNAGGTVIRVVRGAEPEWFDWAISVNRGPDGNTNWALSKNKLEKAKIHSSETAWAGTNFDKIIDNNADGLDNLYLQINDLVRDLRFSKINQP